MASKYLVVVSRVDISGLWEKELLLRFIMQPLRLLLQLLEPPFCIDIHWILCVLALSHIARSAEA